VPIVQPQTRRRLEGGPHPAGIGMVDEGWDDERHIDRDWEDLQEWADLELMADAELRRRMAPPYRPRFDLIACSACGRRTHDDDGRPVHRWWWDWWPLASRRWG
jgi:hypothetical protein